MTRILLKALLFLILVLPNGHAFADICDGRYSKAKALIDKTYSKYGTLYSGGRGNEGLGGTLDIYRMLLGLPDAGLSANRDRSMQYRDDVIHRAGNRSNKISREAYLAKVGGAIERSLRRLHAPLFNRDIANTTSDPEVFLDIYASMGPYLGWWLDPTNSQLSDLERTIASVRQDEGMDWILTVLAASANSAKIIWTSRYYNYSLNGRGYQNLFNHSVRQFSAKENLPWFVAAHLLMDRYSGGRYYRLKLDDSATDALTRKYLLLGGAVKSCTASDGEYVAYSIALFERTRVEIASYAFYQKNKGSTLESYVEELTNLPDVLRNMAAVFIAKKTANYSDWQRRNVFKVPQLRKIAANPSFASWINVYSSYYARSIEELTELNQGIPLDPKTLRMLNMLSVDDLIQFSRSRNKFQLEKKVIFTAALFRMFALGRDKQARVLVPELAELWPKISDEILTIWKSKDSVGYRLAKITQLVPAHRTLIVPVTDWRHRAKMDADMFDNNLQSDLSLRIWSWYRRSWDIPLNMRNGAFLHRDVDKWMETSGASPYAHYSIGERANKRGVEYAPLPIGRGWSFPGRVGYVQNMERGIGSYGAWGELQKLAPQTGLANRVSREFILNARRKSNSVWKRLWLDEEPIANDLSYVIEVGRRMISGKTDGKPVGQVAFGLLHKHFAETEAAKKTRYWYVCQHRCEP